MKLQSTLFIATTVAVLLSAGSAQANINKSLQSACSNSNEDKFSLAKVVSSFTEYDKNDYQSKLATHFNDSNCFGKRMIETSKDLMVNQTEPSEMNTLAITPN